MMVGSTIYITGQVQPGRFDPSRVQLCIGEIQYLSDVHDDLVKKLTIHLTSDKLTEELVLLLGETLRLETGTVPVEFVFHNSDGSSLSMKPAELKIKVTRQLIDFLQGYDSIEYRINAD